MRVHPTVLSARSKRWQSGTMLGILGVLLLVKLMGRPEIKVVEQPVPDLNLIQVVVANANFRVNDPIDPTKVRFDSRPKNYLPADVITSITEVDGKVAMGTIPIGYPIARSMIGQIEANLAVSDAQAAANIELDPVDSYLTRLESKEGWVQFEARIASEELLRKGDRVALAILNHESIPVVVLEDAWVKSARVGGAVLLVPNNRQKILIGAARRFKAFYTLAIPADVPVSPYADGVVNTMEELVAALSGVKIPTEVATANNGVSKETKFKGYAWLPGANIRYAVDKEGIIYYVDSSGTNPLASVRDKDFGKFEQPQ